MALQTCKRCRKRRVKCDWQLPACSNCQQVDVECLFYDEALQQEFPRSYLQALNERVEKLEFEIKNIKATKIPASDSLPTTRVHNRTHNEGHHIRFGKSVDNTFRYVACFLGPGSSARLMERLLKALIEWHLSQKLRGSMTSTAPLMRQTSPTDDTFSCQPFSAAVENRKLELSSSVSPSTQRALIEYYMKIVQQRYPILSAEQEATFLDHENPLRWSTLNVNHPDAQALMGVLAVATALVSRDIEPTLLSASLAYRASLRKSSQEVVLDISRKALMTSKQLIMSLCFLAIYELVNPMSGEAWGLLGRALTSMEQLRAKYHLASKEFDDEFRRLEYTLLVLERHVNLQTMKFTHLKHSYSSVSSHFGRPSRFCEMWNLSTISELSTFLPTHNPLTTYRFLRQVAQGFSQTPIPDLAYFQNLIPPNLRVGSAKADIKVPMAAFYICLHPLFTTSPSEAFSNIRLDKTSSDLLEIIANSAVVILDNYLRANKDRNVISIWMAAERVLEAGAVWGTYNIYTRGRQSISEVRSRHRTSHFMVPLQKCSILLASFAERWKEGCIYVDVWESFCSYLWDLLD